MHHAGDQDFSGGTALHSAAYNNKLDTVQYLASLSEVDINSKDREGATALHKSAYMGDNEVLQLLIDKGADVQAVDIEEATPLHKAAFNGRAWCVKVWDLPTAAVWCGMIFP